MSNPADDTPEGLDAALRSRFAPPPLEHLAVRVAVAAGRRAARDRLVLVALVAALVGAGAMFAGLRMAPAAPVPHGIAAATPAEVESPAPNDPPAIDACPPIAGGATPVRWAETYANALASGFDTGACCSGPVSIRAFCLTTYAAGLDIDPKAGVVICGRYSGGMLGRCTGFLARVDGAPVVVFVCPRAGDPKVEAKDFADLHLHRRELGALVVYELSRAEEARVLPHLIAP